MLHKWFAKERRGEKIKKKPIYIDHDFQNNRYYDRDEQLSSLFFDTVTIMAVTLKIT